MFAMPLPIPKGVGLFLAKTKPLLAAGAKGAVGFYIPTTGVALEDLDAFVFSPTHFGRTGRRFCDGGIVIVGSGQATSLESR
jgi:hypothetical protein